MPLNNWNHIIDWPAAAASSADAVKTEQSVSHLGTRCRLSVTIRIQGNQTSLVRCWIAGPFYLDLIDKKRPFFRLLMIFLCSLSYLCFFFLIFDIKLFFKDPSWVFGTDLLQVPRGEKKNMLIIKLKKSHPLNVANLTPIEFRVSFSLTQDLWDHFLVNQHQH